VEVENAGTRAGEEVVELYLKGPQPGPIRSLEGFQRISLRPGERRNVQFDLQPAQLAHVTAEGRRRIDPGAMEISVGGMPPGRNSAGILSGTMMLVGAPREVD
jgi:beta-glucosidase